MDNKDARHIDPFGHPPIGTDNFTIINQTGVIDYALRIERLIDAAVLTDDMELLEKVRSEAEDQMGIGPVNTLIDRAKKIKKTY